MKKIIIADDHPITIIGLSLICKDLFNEVEIIPCHSLEELTHCISENSTIDLIISDVFFQGISGFSMFESLKTKIILPRLLFISVGNEDIFGTMALKVGALGYINKTADEKEIKNAIMNVIFGNYYLSKSLMNRVISNFGKDSDTITPFSILSKREFEITTYLVKGMNTIAISHILNISSSTVSSHKCRIYEKLGIKTDKEFESFSRQINATDLIY